MTLESHPSLDVLEALAARKLSDDDAASVRRHVDQCAPCQATLARFDGATETYTAPVKPERIGRYELLEKLGEGGMGAVYKARHLDLDKIVAVKVLTAKLSGDTVAIERFRREMKAVGKLEHSNIVRALDAGEDGGTHYLAVEYVDGLDLATWARRHGPASIRQACEIVRQAAVGLDALHQAGIVHRDIKPSNLMLTADDTVKILDLGLARLHRESGPGSELTDTGQTMGTADYIAPEQVTDTRHVDIRADIYSLGCTFYKLLTGQAPFSGPGYSTVGAKLVAHVHDAIPPVTTLRPDVPACVSAILDKMIAKAPDERFANPAELVGALDEVLAHAEWPCLPVQARTQRKPAWQAMQWTKGMIAGTLGAGAATAFAIAGWLKYAGNDDASPGRPDPSDPHTVAQFDPVQPDAGPGGLSTDGQQKNETNGDEKWPPASLKTGIVGHEEIPLGPDGSMVIETDSGYRILYFDKQLMGKERGYIVILGGREHYCVMINQVGEIFRQGPDARAEFSQATCLQVNGVSTCNYQSTNPSLIQLLQSIGQPISVYFTGSYRELEKENKNSRDILVKTVYSHFNDRVLAYQRDHGQGMEK